MKTMEKEIKNVDFNMPTNEIFSNVTAKSTKDPDEIKRLLIEQIEKPVRWREIIENMIDLKVDKFIEIGPGKVLSGMAKRTVKNINCFSINSIDDMKKTVNESKK